MSAGCQRSSLGNHFVKRCPLHISYETIKPEGKQTVEQVPWYGCWWAAGKKRNVAAGWGGGAVRCSGARDEGNHRHLLFSFQKN